ncbi:hypothetical protein MHBO_002342 [Bonamia ostreae]|uniref:CID domain-containing protein n=1 Tax=Bonamia ostreae TaxID=126728 RepID=A0ABV2ALY8_9EUKA
MKNNKNSLKTTLKCITAILDLCKQKNKKICLSETDKIIKTLIKIEKVENSQKIKIFHKIFQLSNDIAKHKICFEKHFAKFFENGNANDKKLAILAVTKFAEKGNFANLPFSPNFAIFFKNFLLFEDFKEKLKFFICKIGNSDNFDFALKQILENGFIPKKQFFEIENLFDETDFRLPDVFKLDLTKFDFVLKENLRSNSFDDDFCGNSDEILDVKDCGNSKKIDDFGEYFSGNKDDLDISFDENGDSLFNRNKEKNGKKSLDKKEQIIYCKNNNDFDDNDHKEIIKNLDKKRDKINFEDIKEKICKENFTINEEEENFKKKFDQIREKMKNRSSK